MTNVILNLEAIGNYSLRGVDSTYILPKAIAELIQKHETCSHLGIYASEIDGKHSETPVNVIYDTIDNIHHYDMESDVFDLDFFNYLQEFFADLLGSDIELTDEQGAYIQRVLTSLYTEFMEYKRLKWSKEYNSLEQTKITLAQMYEDDFDKLAELLHNEKVFKSY